MATTRYTAEAKTSLLIQLPAEAEELHLQAGDKVEVRLAGPAPRGKTHRKGSPTDNGAATQPKRLRGFGMLAGVVSSEDFMSRKQEDIDLEDRPRR
jgi:hypothetical protein